MERLALDTKTWKTPAQAKENFAGVLIEQGKKPLTERVNYVQLFVNENGELTHPEFGEIKSLMEIKTPIDELEFRAVEKLSRWANENDSGFAIWISPPYAGQDESRFIVYELKTEKRKKTVDLHAVCGYHTTHECIAIAEQLQAFSSKKNGIIDSENMLRETPIPFTPQPYSTWVDLLKEAIGPPEVWEVIRNGKHIKMKENILESSNLIVDEYFPQITSTYSDYEHILIGAQMEKRAREVGYEIRQVGPCGISPTYALSLLGTSQTGPFNLLHSKLPTAEGYFPCPKCHKPIPSGRGITICPHCGAKKEDYKICV